MSGYLMYHPPRQIATFVDYTVYHDPIRQSNQDPYVWNKQFLHTYCHITQMRSEINTINFWVTWDAFPNFSQLYCDLVFVVQNKYYWKERNHIDCTDPIVDSKEAFNDHYQWPACGEHVFKKRKRFTLKAHPECSFQPQDANKERIDVVRFLVDKKGLSLDELHRKSRAGFNSQPFYLDDGIAKSLYEWLEQQASIKLTGNILECIRQNNPQLASFACNKPSQGG
jgi:hypothetical protein